MAEYSFQNLKKKRSKPSGISDKVIRLLEIYTMIAQNRYPSVDNIKDRFGVSERSVYRYIEIINSIDPVEYDKDRRGYSFINGDRIKKLMLSNEQLLLLFAMGETVSHLGTPLSEEFQKFMNSMVNIAKTPVKKTFPISIKIPDAIHTEKLKRYFKTISECIQDKRSIDIIYKALHNNETNERRVDPYGLVFFMKAHGF